MHDVGASFSVVRASHDVQQVFGCGALLGRVVATLELVALPVTCGLFRLSVSVPASDVVIRWVAKEHAVVGVWVQCRCSVSRYFWGDSASEGEKVVERGSAPRESLVGRHVDCAVEGAVMQPSCV